MSHPHDPAYVVELSSHIPSTSNNTTGLRIQKMTAPVMQVCNVCAKQFNQLCNLKQHMRTHNDHRPYVCFVCTKSFKQMNHLQTHIRALHTGEKPYSCPVETCSKSFHQLGNMTEHIKRIHSRDPAKRPLKVVGALCPKCGTGYKNNHSLRSHHSKTKGLCGAWSDSVKDGMMREMERETVVTVESTLPTPSRIIHVECCSPQPSTTSSPNCDWLLQTPLNSTNALFDTPQ